MSDKAIKAFHRVAMLVNAEVKEVRETLEGFEAVIGYKHNNFPLRLDDVGAYARTRGLSVLSMEYGAVLCLDGVALREIKGGVLARALA